jgi:hypothetical protein
MVIRKFQDEVLVNCEIDTRLPPLPKNLSFAPAGIAGNDRV